MDLRTCAPTYNLEGPRYQSWFISSLTEVHGVYIYTVNGGGKPTCTVRGGLPGSTSERQVSRSDLLVRPVLHTLRRKRSSKVS